MIIVGHLLTPMRHQQLDISGVLSDLSQEIVDSDHESVEAPPPKPKSKKTPSKRKVLSLASHVRCYVCNSGKAFSLIRWWLVSLSLMSSSFLINLSYLYVHSFLLPRKLPPLGRSPKRLRRRRSPPPPVSAAGWVLLGRSWSGGVGRRSDWIDVNWTVLVLNCWLFCRCCGILSFGDFLTAELNWIVVEPLNCLIFLPCWWSTISVSF